MRVTLLLLFSLLAISSLSAQGLKKYPLGNSGCSAYFYCDPGTFGFDKSPDSSEVYTAECDADGLTYGTICVKLKDKTNDIQQGEDILTAYLDYLKTSLEIVSSAGYGKGHRLKDNENTRGIIDYWKDKEGANWKVTGWTDGKFIGVLYVVSKDEVPETKANVFLNSLVLPGM